MAGQGVKLTGSIPDGWTSVEPSVVNEDAASIVLLRTADLDAPFTTNITVSERVVGPGDDIAVLAETYRQGLTGRAANLVVIREGLISESGPKQYAQELRFTITIDGIEIDIRQSQFLFEVPTEESREIILLQLLYTAPTQVYDSAKSAVVQFMESIEARRSERHSDASVRPPQFSGVLKDHLESRVKALLEQSAGQSADAVICNGDLPAEIGAVQRCALVLGRDKFGVTVTVRGVVDGNVKFDIQVDNKPMV